MSFLRGIRPYLMKIAAAWKTENTTDHSFEAFPPLADSDEKQTVYKGYAIRFRKEPDRWVSRVFAPGAQLPMEDGDTVTSHYHGPEVLIARTRRKIDAYLNRVSAPN